MNSANLTQSQGIIRALTAMLIPDKAALVDGVISLITSGGLSNISLVVDDLVKHLEQLHTSEADPAKKAGFSQIIVLVRLLAPSKPR